MRPHIIWTIFRKEITEALRDRVTLAAVIGLPLLLYPLMILGMTKVQKAHIESEDERVSQAAVWGDAPVTLLTALHNVTNLSLTNWAGAGEDLQTEFRAGKFQPPAEEDLAPTAALDVISGQFIVDAIRRKRAAGRAVLFSTHIMSEAELLCDRILFLHAGRITDSGTLTELLARTGCPNLTEAFLLRARETATVS